MAYTIQFTEDGLKDVKSLPKNVRNFLKRELKEKLARNPVERSEELRAPLAGWRSFHAGRYRVIFKLFEDEGVIAIAGVGQHSPRPAQDIYRRLEVLAQKGKVAEKILATLRGFSPPRK